MARPEWNRPATDRLQPCAAAAQVEHRLARSYVADGISAAEILLQYIRGNSRKGLRIRAAWPGAGTRDAAL
ncbi:hypothetical protein Mro03_51570 [Microbispora rosea subsp. rosea]|nr:hypothetical protein Mro03_51570 [Microbispora rosea subsp. rosea]